MSSHSPTTPRRCRFTGAIMPSPTYTPVDTYFRYFARHGHPQATTNGREHENAARTMQQQMHPMHSRHHLRITTVLADCAAILLPLALLGLLLRIWGLDETEVDEDIFGAWQNALSVLATAFPILFASIVGRSMSATARWRLEKGTTFESVEVLMDSRTVGGTLVTLFQLRVVNILGIGLLALWVTSPLGAQSFIRMLSTRANIEVGTTNVTYFDVGSRTWFPTWLPKEAVENGAGEEDQQQCPQYGHDGISTYSALLLSSDAAKTDPADLWGNVRIPLMEHTATDDHWQEVLADASLSQWSSLRGIPIHNTFTTGNTTFSIESSHISLECSDINILREEEGPEISAIFLNSTRNATEPPETVNGTWYGYNSSSWHEHNSSLSDCGGAADSQRIWDLGLDRFVDTTWTRWNSSHLSPASFINETTLEAEKTNLLFKVVLPEKERVRDPRLFLSANSTCQVLQQYVESRVRCTPSGTSPPLQQNCRVVSQRLSRRPHVSNNLSYLSFPSTFDVLSKQLPNLPTDMPEVTSLSRLLGLDADGFYSKLPAWEGGGQEVMAARLGELLNTLIMSNQIDNYENSLKLSESSTPKNPELFLLAEAKTERAVLLVSVSPLWAMLALVSCLALFASGLASVLFTHAAQGPEVLGYVSASVRDSKFVDVDGDERWLDGLDLTKRLGRQRIRLGMVHRTTEQEPSLGVGHEADTEPLTEPGREEKSQGAALLHGKEFK